MIVFVAKDYKSERREYFMRKLERKKKALKWWASQKPGKKYDEETILESCADIGAEISYINDALEALDNERT